MQVKYEHFWCLDFCEAKEYTSTKGTGENYVANVMKRHRKPPRHKDRKSGYVSADKLKWGSMVAADNRNNNTDKFEKYWLHKWLLQSENDGSGYAQSMPEKSQVVI